ncbi:MAG TPA: LPS assembly protein LptD [Sulfuricurvum sp.]|nr:LPS assembly protein LptD [Sulfuricurvum sp.]
MRKWIYLSLAASTLLLGEDRVELFGLNADSNGSLVHAYGNPVIIYQDKILTADHLIYDRNTSIVEAEGNVTVFQQGQYQAISDYTKLNIETDTRHSHPFYMINHQDGLWMSTAQSDSCESQIDLASGMVSGCNSTDPLWKIHFSSADYNTDKMWMNIYNARLYVQDVPLFYLPYFGYPTDKTRRTGLLIPTFGISGDEGFYYQQPIYFAPHNWWDLELRPQIRTSRGSGLYADFRFVDTPSSSGSIRAGYFKEQEAYALENDLAHLKHYGYDVKYQHSAFLKEWFDLNLDGESGLFVNGSWMNDVDYLNLQQSDETLNTTANQVLSRINMYYSNEDDYVGMYLKHYQYLNLEDNGKTIQILPTLHYHHYLENFLDDHLLVNADAMATHFYRPDGKRAVEGNVNVPVTLQTGLLDNTIDASYTANMSGRVIGFYGNPQTGDSGDSNDAYESGQYAQVDHTFKLSSTLVKPYGSMTHVLAPEVAYTFAGSRYYEGYYDRYHNEECIPGTVGMPWCDYNTLQDPSDTLALGVNNYLFEQGKQILVDRLSQSFRYDDTGNYYGELMNELEWQVSEAISYYNQTAYNHDRNRLTKEVNTVRYNDTVISGALSHYYTDELRNGVTRYSSYWTADASYQYNRHYRVFGLVAYDYREDLFKRSEIGFLYSQRCLDIGLRFVQNVRPILTNANASDSANDSYIFLTLILKPIGGSEFNYKLTDQ